MFLSHQNKFLSNRNRQPRLQAREDEITEKTKLKKSLQQKFELREKGMAIFVEKAECFESNNHRNVTTKELDVLLNSYGVEKKAGSKKAEKVAQWREISAANMEPPMVDVWTAEDEEQLLKISIKEIDIPETYLGQYAAIQKRTAVAVLDFTNEEWESLKRLREADGAERNQVAMANDIDDIIGALGTANETTGGTIDEGAV